SYVLEKTLEPIRNSITSISAGGTIVQLIVKKDGTGQYLSPKLANDSITDASANKRYEIVVYPGVYTETEWIVKDYVSIVGTSRETCWLKGELADNST
ncbi:hypothetical protein, partial [Emticicia sp. W12TSBA100-4]|uniref:hypothetical protein n=1 Tax=Emticicia sp. W12TSBA100-4 TaxID=3160965 RepID=UPI0033066F2F